MTKTALPIGLERLLNRHGLPTDFAVFIDMPAQFTEIDSGMIYYGKLVGLRFYNDDLVVMMDIGFTVLLLSATEIPKQWEAATVVILNKDEENNVESTVRKDYEEVVREKILGTLSICL